MIGLNHLYSTKSQWKGINHKQITRWQHLSQLKASAFFSLQIFFSCYETQQFILGTGTAIWWLTEPHWYTYKKVFITLCPGATFFTFLILSKIILKFSPKFPQKYKNRVSASVFNLSQIWLERETAATKFWINCRVQISLWN